MCADKVEVTTVVVVSTKQETSTWLKRVIVLEMLANSFPLPQVVKKNMPSLQ